MRVALEKINLRTNYQEEKREGDIAVAYQWIKHTGPILFDLIKNHPNEGPIEHSPAGDIYSGYAGPPTERLAFWKNRL
jgi:hypothetical protein